MAQPHPDRIGRYEVIRPLGSGGMGVVYLAEDPALGRKVAIKKLSVRWHDEEERRAELRLRFTREARAAAALTHQHIVTVYDVGEHDGDPFMAMEYVEGETLAALIARGAPMPLERKLQVLVELCSGLAFAHRAGVVHRDIKPANVMLAQSGRVKILDFGLARVMSDSAAGLTQSGMMVGSLNYLSPEHVQGRRTDERSDIFAVGLVLYELLSGHKAYPGTAWASVCYNIAHAQPVPLAELCPDLDLELEDIAARAMANAPDDRYESLAEMGEDLARVQERVGGSAEGATMLVARPASDAGGRPSAVHPPASGSRASGSASAQGRSSTRTLRVHVRETRRLLAADELDAARAECDRACAVDPDDAEVAALRREIEHAVEERQIGAWFDEAAAALDQDALDDAEAAVARVLASRPELADARALQQTVLERRERQARARPGAEVVDRELHRQSVAREPGATPVPAWGFVRSRAVQAAAALVVTGVLAGMVAWLLPASEPRGPAPSPARPEIDAAGDLLRRATDAAAAGQAGDAVRLALDGIREYPERGEFGLLLDRARDEAAREAARTREAADAAGAQRSDRYGNAVRAYAQAQELSDPLQTAGALDLYAQAGRLFGEAIGELGDGAVFLAAARAEYGARRLDPAIENLGRALSLDAADTEALALLARIRKEVSGETARAREAARQAGGEQLTAFRTASAAERRAAGLTGSADAPRWLAAEREAQAAFAAATEEARTARASREREQDELAGRARELLASGDLAGAKKAAAGLDASRAEALRALIAQEEDRRRTAAERDAIDRFIGDALRTQDLAEREAVLARGVAQYPASTILRDHLADVRRLRSAVTPPAIAPFPLPEVVEVIRAYAAVYTRNGEREGPWLTSAEERLRSVYPSVPQLRLDHLRRQGRACTRLQASFDEPAVELVMIGASRGSVSVPIQYDCTPSAGGRLPPTTETERFTLERVDGRLRVLGMEER